MTVGVFVQTNTDSIRRASTLVGYVVQESGCWQWVGSALAAGYGMAYDTGAKQMVLAHRWMWEREHGPIPVGMESHHTCANKGCVNPAHLEIVTAKEHFDRDAHKGEGLALENRRRGAVTQCPRGHLYAGQNLYVHPPTGNRACKQCDRERHKRRYHAAKTQRGESA